MRIDVWSDIVCPWCYVGKRRFERALTDFPHRDAVAVVHRSFELDPGAPAQPVPRLERLRAKYGWSEQQARTREAAMVKTAAAEGLDFHLEHTLSGNTGHAHQLVHLARQHGRADELVELLYRAHFVEGRSVFDDESLVSLAAEAGLGTDQARRVLTEDSYAAAVADDRQAAHAVGARGVPFFVIDGKYGLSGAQPTEVFRAVLDQVWAESHPGPISGPPPGNDEAICADEGCVEPPRRTGT